MTAFPQFGHVAGTAAPWSFLRPPPQPKMMTANMVAPPSADDRPALKGAYASKDQQVKFGRSGRLARLANRLDQVPFPHPRAAGDVPLLRDLVQLWPRPVLQRVAGGAVTGAGPGGL